VIASAGIRVGVSATLVELAVILGFGNESFAKFVVRHHKPGLTSYLADALAANTWQWTGPSYERLASDVGVLVTLVLVGLLAGAVGRSATLARPGMAVFMGVWGSVIVAGAAGHIVTALWLANGAPNDFYSAQFGSQAGWAYISAQAGAEHGLWVGWFPALIATSFAVAKAASGRRGAIAGAPPAPFPGPYPGAVGYGSPAMATAPGQPTAMLPGYGQPAAQERADHGFGEPTIAMAPHPGWPVDPAAGSTADQPTAAFRPPDDRDR
jgi:hypothetical protein